MIFHKKFNKYLVSLALIAAVFFGVHPTQAQAAQKSVLLSDFKFNLSESYRSYQNNFEAELIKSLRSRNFSVRTTDVTPQNNESAHALAYTNNADGVIYGDFSQIGNTFVVNGYYVNVVGNSLPLQFNFPTTSSLQNITDSIASKATQTQSIEPLAAGAIAEVRIEGVQGVDEDLILSRMQISQGDFVSEEKLNDDIRRIWGTGYFNDVSARIIEENAQNILVISVVERPRITELVVNGSDEIDIDEIEEVLTTQTGSVLNDSILVDDLERVRELYREKGYYNVQVDYVVTERATGTASLVFNVTEGNLLYVTDIVINGVEALDIDDLDKYLLVKERKWYSFLTGSGTLKEQDLDRDTQTITAYAVNQGFINATVDTPEITYAEDGIIVTFNLTEGPRYSLNEITFAGNLIDSNEVFYDLIALDEWKETNQYFSLNTLQDDVKKLTTFYNDQGYAFAQVQVRDNPNPETQLIDITYFLNPNEKTYVNRVNIEGNYKTRDNVVLREMRLADGDLYSGSKIARTEERLYKTDYFSSVEISPQPTDDPALVDLLVKVEEKSTGTLTAGFGYSTYDGFGVSAGISQNNLFGKGYKVGLDGYISGKDMNMTGYFWNPRLYDTDLGVGISLYGIDQEWIEYDRSTIGGKVSLGYPLGEYTYLSVSYKLENYELSEVDETASRSIKDSEGNNWASVISASITRDTTNALFDASRGTKVKITAEYGGGFLGGDDDFIKGIFEIGGYYALADDHILHARGTIGAIFENGSDTIPSFERFYIGGMNTIRGYEYEEISPRDPLTGDSIGADRVSYASLEYIWHFNREFGLALVPFFDIATSVDSEYNSNFFGEVYMSTGLEVRWRSPMGDLRFAYGFPLSENVDGKKRDSGRFEFSMGRAF